MSLQPHSSNSTVEGNEETHEKQFRGTFAPISLHQLVEQGKITATAAWLVMVIDSLSRTDRGCWASNAYLGKTLRKSSRTIARLLEALERVKMLRSEWVGDERRLYIDWTMASQDTRKKMYKSEVRQSDRHDKTCTNTPRHDESGMSVLTCIQRQGFTKVEEPRKSIRTHGEPSVFKEMSTYLREHLRKNNQQVGGTSIPKWEEPLRLLEERDGIPREDWVELLKWYCQYLHPEKRKSLCQKTNREKAPSIQNGEQFRKQYSWIRDIKRDYDHLHEDFQSSRWNEDED